MNIKVIGCRDKIKYREELIKKIKYFGKENKIACQIMDAEMIYSKEHVVSAVEHAVRAFKNKTNSCNTLDMEILLYASGKRQIKDAIDVMGIKDGEKFVFVSAGKTGIADYNGEVKGIEDFIKNLGVEIDNTVINGNDEFLKKFGIGKKELETVDKSMYGDLILEKVAMVDVIK
ncbi:MAG: KEOPS complex subunit Cgi121 [Candidatus Thermoplasmatota archaeon]|nr:KEOPS complex subunit Cgi121 [Candidatus Thermoplasmatota archaeon]